jgi:preprotein translocase subunit SecA
MPERIVPPPATHDWRPERKDRVLKPLENIAFQAVGLFRRIVPFRRHLRAMIAGIRNRETRLEQLADQELQQERSALRHRLQAEGLVDELVMDSFALVRETSRRVLGLRHHDSQLEGGLVMLNSMIAEMDTGEGKTLTATLTAATAALAGIPVHVVSVNDYLTGRDAESMHPLYAAFGLRVGCVVHGQTPGQRQTQYRADITYATNKELVFDYLRDRLTLGERTDHLLLQSEQLHGRTSRCKRLLLRGLHFAIVDEADSILIDEARTPLILSGGDGGKEEREFLEQALELARSLQEGEDFQLDKGLRQLRLADTGRKRIEVRAKDLGPLWNGLVRRESTVHQALTALHLFHRDEQYLLKEGKVQIVDEFTGRVMADRSWEQGLHQLIELKEGCEMTQRREALAKISFQRFFRRYLHLSGMTGTAKEVAGELWTVYGLVTRRIPTNRPVIRRELPDRIHASLQDKWPAVVRRVARMHGQGRPVLIGTRSVAASEQLSQHFSAAGLEHQLLNAKQDAEEAAIVARAGELGCITVATNMAGRGTDIRLGQGVKEQGGLHVIITERHEAARIDRQLAGRCGRQGDPGSYEAILSCEDQLFEGHQGALLLRMARSRPFSESELARRLARWVLKLAQQNLENHHARMRRALFRQDQAQGSLLSFSGPLE